MKHFIWSYVYGTNNFCILKCKNISEFIFIFHKNNVHDIKSYVRYKNKKEKMIKVIKSRTQFHIVV